MSMLQAMSGDVESHGNIEVSVSDHKPSELKEQQRNGELVDVIVVGGGPAGLSCSLILARANRTVHLFDAACTKTGDKRNEVSHTQHAILGADGFVRSDFIDQARHQVMKYPSVSFYCKEIVDVTIAAKDKGDGKCIERTWGFKALAENGEEYYSKKLVLCTGVKDMVPEVLSNFWGRGVWSCLYCDGYEYNGVKLGAYGNGQRGTHIALEMLLWSKDVTLFTDGETLVANKKERQLLKKHNIRVIEDPIAKPLGGEAPHGHLEGLQLESGEVIPVRAVFFNTGRFQANDLPARMKLPRNERGDVITSEIGKVESIHGLFVAGNSAAAPLKLVMTASSQGAIVGAKLNSSLLYEELGLDDNEGGTFEAPLNNNNDADKTTTQNASKLKSPED